MNARTFMCMLAAVILAAACSTPKEKYAQPKFPEEKITAVELLTEDQLWGGPAYIFKYADILVVVSSSKDSDCWLHLYSTDGRFFGEFVRTGRGPKEFSGVSQAYMSGPMLYLMSYMSKTTLVVDVSRVLEDGDGAVSRWVSPDDSNWLSYAFPASAGNVVAIYRPKVNCDIPYDPARICLYDFEGNAVSAYNESPYSDLSPRGRSYLEFAMACRTISPDGKHLALAANVGAVLEIFSIDKEVNHVMTSYYVDPQFEENGNNVHTNVKSIAGFGYLYGGNEHLFAVYDGKTSFKDKRNGWFRNIAVFDWNGEPQKLIKTDWSIEAIVTDDDGETFYAVVSDPDRREYLARLK